MNEFINADNVKRKMIEGARQQYRAMFRNMASSYCQWHMHRGSAGFVLLQEGASMDVDLPIVARGVQAMSEQQMVNALTF